MGNRGVLPEASSEQRLVRSTLFGPRQSSERAWPMRPVEQSAGAHARGVAILSSPGWTGRLAVNLDSRTVAVDGEPIELSSKEYSMLEILFRRALAGRSDDAIIRTGRLSLNLNRHRVEIDGRPVSLTNREYAIMEILSLRKGTPMSKAMLLDHLYDRFDGPEIKIIDVFICKLRKKLAELSGGDTFIETVRSRGYVLRDPQEDAA